MRQAIGAFLISQKHESNLFAFEAAEILEQESHRQSIDMLDQRLLNISHVVTPSTSTALPRPIANMGKITFVLEINNK